MVFTIENLCDACRHGDIQTVRDIVSSKEVDINDTKTTNSLGITPLLAVYNNHTEIVSFLLTQPELQIDKRNAFGNTALHLACCKKVDITVIRLFCQDRRCTPSFVNIKNNNGRTALMLAVMCGELEMVKEMEKVEGIDFDTKDSDGRTLIEAAKTWNSTAVLEYLWKRRKKTLRGMAANSVAKHLKNKEDINALVDGQHIPQCLKPLVASFFYK